MKVFFDTCSIMPDFHLKGEMFRIIKSLAGSQNLKLYVPEIVRMELIAKYYEAVKKQRESLESMAKDAIHQLLADGVDATAFLLAMKLVTSCKYHKALNARFAALGITVIPIPEISHAEMVKWALSRKKPFSEGNDKGGYRDALIWLSLVNVAGPESERVAFVTPNKKDFYAESKSNAIHADLTRYLVRTSLRPQDIILYKNLGSFVEDEVLPNLDTADDMIKLFEENATSRLSLREGIEKKVPTIYANLNWHPLLKRLNCAAPERGFHVIHDRVSFLKVSSVHKVDDDTLLVMVDTRINTAVLESVGDTSSLIDYLVLNFRFNVAYSVPKRKVLDVAFLSCYNDFLSIEKGLIDLKSTTLTTTAIPIFTTTTTTTIPPSTTTITTTSSGEEEE